MLTPDQLGTLNYQNLALCSSVSFAGVIELRTIVTFLEHSKMSCPLNLLHLCIYGAKDVKSSLFLSKD
ncbi:hypothetical protein HZS_1127, partial [Henneguya salminicola]